MPTADENERVPVAVLNVFALACPIVIFCAAAVGVPAVELNLLPFDLPDPITETLFGAHNGGRQVLLATIACAVLGFLQLAAVRDPVRGTRRYKFGIALAAVGIAAGLVLAHGAFQVGFVPILEEIETRPRIGAYVALFGGVGFAALSIVRLTRFF